MPTAHVPGFWPSTFAGHCVSAMTPNFQGLPFSDASLLAANADVGLSHGTAAPIAAPAAPTAPDLTKSLRSM